MKTAEAVHSAKVGEFSNLKRFEYFPVSWKGKSQKKSYLSDTIYDTFLFIMIIVF